MLKVAIEFLSKMSILYHILLAPQSGAHRIAPHRDPSNPIQSIQPTYSCILRGKAERITPNYKGWLPRAKLKKIQEGIVGFGCNFGGMIAHLYRSHSPGYTQIRQG